MIFSPYFCTTQQVVVNSVCNVLVVVDIDEQYCKESQVFLSYFCATRLVVVNSSCNILVVVATAICTKNALSPFLSTSIISISIRLLFLVLLPLFLLLL